MNCRIILLGVIFCLFGTLPRTSRAQITPSPAPPRATIVTPDNPRSFDPAAATQAWLDTVPAGKRASSDAYFEGGYWLILWDFLVSAAIAIWLLHSRTSARLRDWVESFTRFKALQAALFAAALVVIS